MLFSSKIVALALAVSSVSAGHIGLCKFDCDTDADCMPGLYCSDAHKPELAANGFDSRKANCKRVGGPLSEVCFDPKILGISGGTGGDPHFRTYDGTKYSYHGQCDLVLTRSTDIGSGLSLDIHVRTEIVDDWSLISNAALRVGNDVFELANDGSYYLNGAKNGELPLKMEGKYTITRNEEMLGDSKKIAFVVELEHGDKIDLSVYKTMISVRVDAVFEGAEGLLGIHGKKGMVGRDGVAVIEDPNEMGAEWQVTDSERMLFHELRAPQYPERCMLPKTDSRRLEHSVEKVNRAKEACARVSAINRDFCIQDVLMTGDVDVSYGYAF